MFDSLNVVPDECLNTLWNMMIASVVLGFGTDSDQGISKTESTSWRKKWRPHGYTNLTPVNTSG